MTHTISDLDVWRVANMFIRQYGAEAELFAAQRADLMLDRGDRDGQLVWVRVGRAIRQLQSAPSGPLN